MLYKKTDKYELRLGKMQEELLAYDSDSIDSIVTDPPYELGFMGKSWDSSGVAFQKETWGHCYRVLKPGGYLLAFGGSRTYHRIACAIEDAGFEIRDTIQWIYGSGFPKSMNIGLVIDKKNGVESTTIGVASSGVNSRAFQSEETTTAGEYEIKKANNEWNGWGTCLKPAYEPIIVARKPFDTSIVDNIETYGVGGINIDECRVPFINGETNSSIDRYSSTPQRGNNGWNHKNRGANFNEETVISMQKGRFPANVILTYDDSDFEEVCGGFPETKSTGGSGEKSKVNTFANTYAGGWGHDKECSHLGGLGDEGSAARYFYCAKASKKDRDEGLEEFSEKFKAGAEFRPNHMEKALEGDTGNPFGRWNKIKNIHPTVKPTELMQYLVRLVTPRNGVVLDPFMGSGSTGKACMIENKERNVNYKFIGVEMTEEYLPICEARINFGMNYVPDFTPTKTEVINEVKKVKENLW